MFVRSVIRSTWRTRPRSAVQYSSIHAKPPPFPTIPTCPAPSCSCAETPTMPFGKGIDHSRGLNGTMAPYAEQVLICTGKEDWMSKIEEENSGDNLAADIKELVGRGGVYSDPYHNIAVANASFPSSVPSRQEVQTTSVYLLPSFKYVPFLPRVSFDSVQALVKGYLLPKKLNPAHEALSPIHRDRLLRSEEQQQFLYGVQDVKDVLVLICGHGGRDVRCGILGPVLRDQFEACLPDNGLRLLDGPVQVQQGEEDVTLQIQGEEDASMTARVALISHIGGHKFAGNIIIYIPPGARTPEGQKHALEGCGIWYGRVEPAHVEGIIRETVLGGRVIEDLFRGGIKQGGEILRM